MKNVRTCIVLFAVLSIITGVIYPSSVTAVAQLFFLEKANGSLIRWGDNIRGSQIIGQKFISPAYFWGRPSTSDYSALPSSASNLGPTSISLKQNIEERNKAISQYITGTIPADILMASGSGLDPHISPESALVQVDHVSKARHLNKEQKKELETLVKHHIEEPEFGVFGATRVNVLNLNMETDHLFGVPQ